MKFPFICAFFLTILLSACSEDSTSASDDTFDASVVCPENLRGTFIDIRDGEEYKYTVIGPQTWMAENLRFNNGVSYTENSHSVGGHIYGIESAKNSCPSGWHLPSIEEWLELFRNVGGVENAGIRLKTVGGWVPLNPGQLSNGTDDCGFSVLAVPTSRAYIYGYEAMFWTSSPAINPSNSTHGIVFETQNIYVRTDCTYNNWEQLSVRCIKD